MVKKQLKHLSEERNNFKPFNYPWAYDSWLKHEQSHWLHTEVPMAEDVKDWKNRLSSEKIGKADKVAKKIERQVIEEIDLKQLATEEVCLACEG